MLELDHLLIRQDDFSLAADWQLAQGQKLAILGPSGGGKTTLLSAIAGFVALSQGRIRVDGIDITDLPPARRPVSILFQEHNLFAHLDVAQNVGLGLRPNLRLSRAEHDRIAEALTEVGLTGFQSRRPASLSGGQRQRVALARALLRNKPVLMLDEPFAALGPALKAEMLDLVKRIVGLNETTLLMVTHDPGDARRIADQISFVADGNAAAPEPTEALFNAPPPALAAYLGNPT
ncbi:MAG: thiamine ABC transporter ATP-binding protein [Rhodobacteraceae bacterium]|nr:thiamine ABC transporter ATP-binding protein [Paracoccaceae bacterium]